jgi:hypothetical protein
MVGLPLVMCIDVGCVNVIELLIIIFTFKDEEEQDWQTAKAPHHN